ncbi:hypothetical protein ACQP25_33470 [Microtetraspora malaysiensis]|uniref:hypothetical protein n=1 Tax=Microtetraspora malaysiensis TaxID=161358 RepID=UPI003D8A15F1
MLQAQFRYTRADEGDADNGPAIRVDQHPRPAAVPGDVLLCARDPCDVVVDHVDLASAPPRVW